MNFVIFSYHFLPEDSAEGYCAARFANALAEAGQQVHVVAPDWPPRVSQDVVAELLPAVKHITKVAVRPQAPAIFPRLRYQTPEWDAVNYASCIAALKSVLRQYDRPVLISRMCPAASGIIAWHCRKYAWKWIHHFSDPFPMYLKGGLLGRIMNCYTRRWAKRFLTVPDKVSITCNEVKDFFLEKFPRRFDARKLVLTPHIGEPFLRPEETPELRKLLETPVLAHTGNCYDGRYAKELIRELQILKRHGQNILFLQAGDMLPGDIDLMARAGIGFRQIKVENPRISSYIFRNAAINCVIDLKTETAYIPFIPSKFVYLLFTERPFVVFSRKASWMYRLSREYPESGILFADVNGVGELAGCAEKILQNSSGSCDRTRIRGLFSKKSVAENFIRMVEAL